MTFSKSLSEGRKLVGTGAARGNGVKPVGILHRCLSYWQCRFFETYLCINLVVHSYCALHLRARCLGNYCIYLDRGLLAILGHSSFATVLDSRFVHMCLNSFVTVYVSSEHFYIISVRTTRPCARAPRALHTVRTRTRT